MKRKTVKGISDLAYAQFLDSQAPFYDAQIIKDIRPEDSLIGYVETGEFSFAYSYPLCATLDDCWQLPASLRIPFRMRYFQGKSWAKIAERCETTPKVARKLYKWACRELRGKTAGGLGSTDTRRRFARVFPNLAKSWCSTGRVCEV